MVESLGPFKTALPAAGPLAADAGSFLVTGSDATLIKAGPSFKATLVPVASPGALRLTLITTGGVDFTVDWGDGSPITYSSGTVSPGVVPTGDVIVETESTNITAFRIVDNQIKTCSIIGGANLKSLGNTCTNKTAIESFTIDSGVNITSLNQAFSGASGLTTFTVTDSDLSSATNFSSAFRGSALTSFGNYNLDSIDNAISAWRDTAITSFPAIDLSSATSLRESWEGCTSLTSFGGYDFGACTNFIDTFRGCTSVTTIGNLQTEAGTNFAGMFLGCSALTTIGALDTTSTVGASSGMFTGCTSLTSPNSATQTDLADSDGADFN